MEKQDNAQAAGGERFFKKPGQRLFFHA